MTAAQTAIELESFILVASLGNDGQAKLLFQAGEELLTGDKLDMAWRKFGALFKELEKPTQGTTGEEENSTNISQVDRGGAELTEEDADAYYQVETEEPLEQLGDDSVEGNREKEKILIQEILNEANKLSPVENPGDDAKADTASLENLFEQLKLETEEPTIDTGEISLFKEEFKKNQEKEEKRKARKLKAFAKSPEVVTTPVLKPAGLWYNLYAQILICSQCNTGVLFNVSSLIGHFSTNSRNVHPGCELNSWKPQRMREYMDEVVESLQSLDVMKDKELVIRKKQKVFTAFKPTNEKPVFGIPIQEGFHCTRKECTTAWILSERHECSDTKAKASDKLSCPGYVQSLSSSYKSYFKVNHDKRNREWHDTSVDDTPNIFADSKQVEVIHGPSAESQKNFLHHLRAQVDTKMNSILKQDQSTLSPVFEYTGVNGWLNRFPDRSRIASIMPPMPHLKAPSTDKHYKVLREVILWMFAKDMGILGGGGSHPGIGRIMTNGSRSIDTRKEFTRVNDKATASTYAAVEANMIWTFIMFFESQPLPSDPLFIFNVMQRDAVYRVRDVLGSSIENWTSTDKQRENVAEPIRTLLGMLYFPEHMPYSNPIAAQPNLQYICYGTIQPNGDYLPIHLIPPPLAAHQYVMRLKGLFYLHHAIISKGYDQSQYDDDWMSFAKDWVDKYLVDTCLYPFDILKRMIHGFGRVSMATPRPGVVRWDTVKESLRLNLFGYLIEFERYRHCLHMTLLQLEKFITEDVLLGVYASIRDVDRAHGISFIKDNGDETTPGYGIISEATGQGLSNKESDLWFEQIPFGKLGAHSSPEKIFSWLLAIHQAYSNLFVLIYATSYAGRGSEFEKARPINIGTQSRRNVIYDQEAYTGAFDSDYHKGFSITGLTKHNRRYMPYSIFRLLYIMVRIVRPIELALLLHIYPNASKSLKDSYVEAYNTRLFVSHGQQWTSEVMKNSLKKWFKENLGLPNFGLHDFRHLAIALQAKFVDLNMPVNELQRMNDQLVGHSTEVAHSHYAREAYLGSCPRIERQMSLYLARQYHKALGFATGSNEPDPELLDELRKAFYSNQATPSTSKAIISGVHVPNGLKDTRTKKRTRAKRSSSVEPKPAAPLRRTARDVKKKAVYTVDTTSEEDERTDEDEDEDEDKFIPEQSPQTEHASTFTGMMTRKRASEAESRQRKTRRK